MQRLTKEQGIVISGYTGILIGGFNDMLRETGKRLGQEIGSIGLAQMPDSERRNLFATDWHEMLPELDGEKEVPDAQYFARFKFNPVGRHVDAELSRARAVARKTRCDFVLIARNCFEIRAKEPASLLS